MTTVLRRLCLFLLSLGSLVAGLSRTANAEPPHDSPQLEVGSFCTTYPYGITLLIHRDVAFVINPETDIPDSRYGPKDEAMLPYPTCAPDGSYFTGTFTHGAIKTTWTFGKLNDHAVGAILTTEGDHPSEIPLGFLQPFSGCKTDYWREADGIRGNGYAANTGLTVPIHIHAQPPLTNINAAYSAQASATCTVEPSKPTILVITTGDGPAPSFDSVKPALDAAGRAYAARRISSEGDWGNYVGAIADVMNTSRYFSSLDRVVSHAVGRGWWIAGNAGHNADFTPYFGWDSNFNGALSCLEDPATAYDTVRAVFSLQDPEGMISNYSHWPANNEYVAAERTDPPVAAFCVWKMYQRRPDRHALAELYPKIVKWHDWWHTHRAKPGEFLLSWGSGKGDFKDAQLETGWDDTPSFGDGHMVGNLLNEYNVDLNSLWAMDAEDLAHLADALGKDDDAKRFRAEHERMVKEMNDRLWNESLGLYCNRGWDNNPDGTPHFITRITPMNFYPLITGAPDAARAKRMLAYLHDPKKFWGDYLIPTLPYDDPDFHQQGYWHGHTWAPVNYLLWQGLVKYDDNAHLAELARRSVKLFMNGWTTNSRICSENYRSDTGAPDDDPHYTWGALLPLIGVEALVDIGPDLQPIPRQLGLTENLTLHHIPMGGKLYRVENRNAKVTVTPE